MQQSISRLWRALLAVAILFVTGSIALVPSEAVSWPTGEPLPDATYTCVKVIGSGNEQFIPPSFDVEAYTMNPGSPYATHYLAHPVFGVMVWYPPHYEDLHGNTWTPEDGIADYVPKDETGDTPEHIEGGYTESHTDGSGHSGYTLR